MKRKTTNQWLVILATALLSVTGITAQETSEEEVKEGLLLKQSKVPLSDNGIYLKFGGYADAYYGYHTASAKDAKPGYAGGTANTGRIFESASEQFTLGLIQTKFEMGNNDWQVVADLIHGPNAELTNFNNLSPTGESNTSTAIKQAYMSAGLIDNLTLTVGQFGTHIGYEVVESYQNANYMLGYLFGYGPFYHTGAKLDYNIADKVGVMVGVVNGWDSYVDNNREKTAIAQLSFPVLDPLTLIINYAGGNEGDGWQNIGDIVIQYDLTSSIKLGLNLVAGNVKPEEGDAMNWGGAAFYLSYVFTDAFTLSYRGEYFDDKAGVRGLGPASVQGHTLTGTISMYDGHFLIRPEVKYDLADRDFYGVDGSLKKDNVSALIAFTGVF